MSDSSMKILIVHFINHPMIGKSLDPLSYITQGQSTPDSVMSLSDSGTGFLRIDHRVKRPSKEVKDYAEYVPWAQVSKVIFED